MKYLKRITAVLLAVLFALTPLMGVPFEDVFALGQGVIVTTSAEEPQTYVGGTVELSVTLSEAVTAKAFALDFSSAYDHNVFEWVDGQWSDQLQFSAMTHVDTEHEVAAFLNYSPVTAEGEIFTLTLRAKDSVACNTTTQVEVAVSGIDGATTEAVELVVGHKYSNLCDPDCDVCGAVREPDEHEYENACDADCNVCGTTRTAPHVFDNEGDDTCNACGEIRVIAYELITEASADRFAFGDTLTVTVSLSKPKFTKSFALYFLNAYDHNAFEWVSGDWAQGVKDLGGLYDVNPGSEAVFLATAGIEVPVGEIFTFTLRVKDTASCRKAYELKAGITTISNVTLIGDKISMEHSYSSDCDPRCDVCEMPRSTSVEHKFDNLCDDTCDLCGETRLVAGHVYDFPCSSTCTVCGDVREGAHTYDSEGDEECNICGEVRFIPRDLTTVIESETASVGDTVTVNVYLSKPIITNAIGLDFETAYDHDKFEWVDGYWSGTVSFNALTEVHAGVDALFLSPNAFAVEGLVFTMVLKVKAPATCGETLAITVDGSALHGATPVGDTLSLVHKYENACDAECDGCGETRLPDAHVYDNACDTDCNVCGDIRTTSHSYDHDGDESCNVCGAEREILRDLTTALSVTEVVCGKEITVTVSLSQIKQTQSFALDFQNAYDHDAFEWVSGSWSAAITASASVAEVDAGNAAVFLAVNAIDISGEIFTFTLRAKGGDFCGTSCEIKAAAPGIENLTLIGQSVSVDHDYDNVCDAKCDGCGTERDVPGHQYDHDGDESCNNCGELRLAFYGTSLTLQNNFSINYKVKAELAEIYSDFYVEVEMNGETQKITSYTKGSTYLSFRFDNIAPQTIGDSITATLHAKKGEEDFATKAYVFGVSDYCNRALELFTADNYASFRTLVVDLLHYAAKAQVYTGYKTSELVDAQLTAQQLAWGTQGDPVLENHFNPSLETVENAAATWYGAGLVLDTAVTLKLKFAAESVDGLIVRIETESGKILNVPSNYFEYKSSDGLYYLYVNGLHASQMGMKLKLTIVDANGNAVSNTAQYSIESYAYEKQNSTIPGLADLVKAMMNYGNAAEAYAKEQVK